MRLVKLGLGSVNTTVGAFGANVDRAPGHGQGDGRGRTSPWPSSPSSWSAATRRKTWCSGRPSSTASGSSSSATRRRPPRCRWCRVLGVAVAHQGLRYNCAAVVAGGAVARPGAQGEAAHLQHLLRGAHLRPAATPACDELLPGRAAGRPALRIRLRRPGRSRCARTLERRRADAPPRLLRRRAHLQPLGVALPRRRGGHPARAASPPAPATTSAPWPTSTRWARKTG